MNPNPVVVNRVIYLAGAMLLAVISFFVVWGTIKLSAYDIQSNLKINNLETGAHSHINGSGQMNEMISGMASSFAGLTVPVTGRTGKFLGTPYWVWISAVIFTLVIQTFNLIGFSAVPRSVVVGLLMIGLSAAAFSILVLLLNGTVGGGPFLLLAASVIGLSQTRGKKVIYTLS